MTAEELDQCLLDIASWLESKAGAAGADFVAMPAADDQALAQLPPSTPDALKAMLRKHDGKMPVYDFTSISCVQIAEATAAARSADAWKEDFVPFARNAEGDLLILHSSGHHISPRAVRPRFALPPLTGT